MRKKEIEAKAKEMGVDLSQPYARAYVVAVLKSEVPRPYVDREPGDASGYTEDFGAVLIRKK